MARGRVRRVKPDEELTLVEHLDELRHRLIVTVATLTVAIAVCFWKSEAILHFLRGPINDAKFIALSPLDPFMTSLTISIYCGILITLPIATYQLYAFIIPAFSEEYHRTLRPLILMIPALFIIGVVFAWELVVPPALHFLVNYNSTQFVVQLRASNYVQFLVWMLAAFGLIFELPVVMLILAKIGLVTSERMRRHWRISIVILAVIATVLPGVDFISFVLEFGALLVLYVASYGIVRLVERSRPKDEPDVDPTPAT
jgi:sec-independent protein translocase protein TatC